jgi:hypothetical protein
MSTGAGRAGVDFLKLPFFTELEGSERVLIAGAGGGFDVFSGLPLFFALREAGKQVYLANLSFSWLGPEAGERITPTTVAVTADSVGWGSYFPELHLARWFRSRGEEVPIYSFVKTGARPLAEGYQALVERLDLDTIILVDGGTDSLMRGDEPGLGTPEEDVASIAAVARLDVPTRLLVCLGFGVDTYHGVCHSHFLEAVADLTRTGHFLGAWSLTAEMPEVMLYAEATLAVLAAMPDAPSIVSTSILSAVAGQFGDYHATRRTHGSTLFINPLMTLYWCFRMEAVAARLLYPEALYTTDTPEEITMMIHQFRASLPELKDWKPLPM